jgi:DNA adenine methylase
MQYQGGKARIATQIAAEIDKVRRPGQLVWDAFCGGLGMACELKKTGPVLATDANVALMSLYSAVQRGWAPPEEVSKELWQAAKTLPDTDPMKAYCGICCSFAGTWFRAYAKPIEYATVKTGPQAGRSMRCFRQRMNFRRCCRELQGLTIGCLDFLSVNPGPTDGLIYCDAPYARTTGYAGVKAFDFDAYYQRLQDWSEYTSVFCSEYELPLGECVWEGWPKTKGLRPNLHTNGSNRPERLFLIARKNNAPAAETAGAIALTNQPEEI